MFRMVRRAAWSCAVLGTVILTCSCSSLPGSGPSADSVVEGAGIATAQGLFARYEVIDLDAAAVSALRGRVADSLLTSFGDHRPSVEPVIGVGDILAVTIWEAGSGGLFSGPLVADRFSSGSKSATIPEQVVGRDGSITVPYAGRVLVSGLRPQDVQRKIEEALAGQAIQPQVLVSVTSPLSASVTVIGEAASAGASVAARTGAATTGGGRVALSARGDRILDVIASSGGIRSAVNETFVRLSRGPRTATVALTAIVSNPRENIYLRPGDVLTLVRDPQTFLALGATGVSYEIAFNAEGITLAQALAKSGGLRDVQADPAGIFVFRFEPEALVRRLRPDSTLLGQGSGVVPVVYRINLRDPNSLFLTQAFRMANRDMVYVSNAPFAELQKVLGVFNTVTSPIAAGASVYSVAK